MEKFNFDLLQGSAPILRFRLTLPEVITDWNTTFYLNDKVTDELVFSANGAIADIGQVPDAETVGVFDVPLSATETHSFGVKSYNFSFWRVNEGYEDPLVSGTIHVKKVR